MLFITYKFSKIKNIISVTFHLRIIFAIVLKEEERRRIVAIVMIIYVNVAKMPTAELKVYAKYTA